MEVMKGTITASEACRRYGFTNGEYQEWVDRFMQAGENGLKAKQKDEEALAEQRVKDLQAKVGELYMENEILKKAHALRRAPEQTF